MKFRQFPCRNTTIAYINTQYFKWSKRKNPTYQNLLVDVGIKIVVFSYHNLFAQCLRGCCKKKVEIFLLVYFSFLQRQKELKLKGRVDLRKLSIHLWNNFKKKPQYIQHLNWWWTKKALLIFTPCELKTSFNLCPPIFVMQPSLAGGILIYWLP